MSTDEEFAVELLRELGFKTVEPGVVQTRRPHTDSEAVITLTAHGFGVEGAFIQLDLLPEWGPLMVALNRIRVGEGDEAVAELLSDLGG